MKRCTRRMGAVWLLACAALFLGAPDSAADPGGSPGPADPVTAAAPDPAAPAPDAAAPAVDTGAPAVDPAATASDTDGPSTLACKQFSAALSYAATNYEDFADATAGGGNSVDYANPQVHDSNVIGRTALRAAAATAWSASTTPGLPGNISAPMQSWSLRATKLLLVMGVHGGGDTLNNTAVALNQDAHDAQLACAQAGTPA